MSAANRLIEAVAPLGYGSGGLSDAELTAVGEELDALAAELEETEREMSLVTASDWGLELVQAYLRRYPNAPTLQYQRESLMSLLRIGGGSGTIGEINDTLNGCGLIARVRETDIIGQIEVYFPEIPGEPDGFSAMKVIIEAILPCHLEVQYYFWKIEWNMLERLFATWNAVEAMGFDFETLEKYVTGGSE